MSKSLYSLAQDRFTKVPVSFQTTGGTTTRPSFRVPFRVQGGAFVSQGTGNGDSLGRGNMSIWNDFVLSPVWHYAVNEVTHLSQLAVNGKKRGLISLKAEELKNSLDSAMAGIEGIMYGDSSGAITQIPTTGTVSSGSGTGNQTSFITGVRAMAFTDNQIIQVFPSEGGTSRGVATISINDPVTSTLWFSTVLPFDGRRHSNGRLPDDCRLLGCAEPGRLRNNRMEQFGDVGNHRRHQPRDLSQPYLHSLDQPEQRCCRGIAFAAHRGIARPRDGGDNKTKDSGIYLMGEDQAVAIATTNYYNKQITQNSDGGGGGAKEVPDTSRKYFQGKFGGRDVHLSYVQPLGRIDMLLTNEWYIGELVPLQLYDYAGGNTVMPVPDPGGNGWLTSSQFTYEISFNFACSAPRHQLYVYNASQTTI